MVGFFTTWASSPQMAEPLFKSVSGAAERYPDSYFALSAIAAPEMQRRYEAAGIGVLEDPWRAVEAVAAATRCAERHRHPAATRSRRCRPACRRCPKRALGEHEAKAILADAGMPILEERLVTSAAEAASRGAASATSWC